MSRTFRLDNVWRAALADLHVSQEAILRRAELPLDLLRRPDPHVDLDGFYRLVEAVDAEADRPDLALHLGRGLSVDVFDPTLFAAGCAPNLDVAVERVSAYKRLMGPLRLDVARRPDRLRLVFGCLDRRPMPRLLGMVDMTFSAQWVRHVTRAHVVPTYVGAPELPADVEPYAAFFGTRPVLTDGYVLEFSDEDARRPFVTTHPAMWATFEPELRRRLVELDAAASFEERLRVVLLELLPSGRTRKVDAARALGVGERTLQRRLEGEGTSFQGVLAKTREALARHYLCHTQLTPNEIAYLLGFGDPNSFYRSFRRWTGTTPEQVRRAR